LHPVDVSTGFICYEQN